MEVLLGSLCAARGSWMKQHEDLEKLNLQSHHNAMANADEFVMEAAITHDKLAVLVHELLAVEAWTDHVLPHLLTDMSEKNSLRAYFVVRGCMCSAQCLCAVCAVRCALWMCIVLVRSVCCACACCALCLCVLVCLCACVLVCVFALRVALLLLNTSEVAMTQLFHKCRTDVPRSHYQQSVRGEGVLCRVFPIRPPEVRGGPLLPHSLVPSLVPALTPPPPHPARCFCTTTTHARRLGTLSST